MRHKWMLVIGLLASLVVFGQKNDSPEAMLGGGLHQEEVEANCKEAIKIYEKVTQEKNAPRNVVARAQLHIGICREKLAQDEARAAYRQVLEKYADQRDIAAEATGRLTALDSKMPQAYLGTWNGIVDEPLHPYPRYPASVRLFGGPVGTVVGTFAYLEPLDCGGEWTLQSVSSDSIELIEKLRPGVKWGCVSNGSITLKLASNGALEYRWRHATVPNIATATLSKSVAAEATGRLTALDSKMPQAYLGAWNGIVDEPLHPYPRYPASVRLFGGLVGTVVGTFAYLDPLDCGGEWTLQSVSSDSIELIEKLRPGVNRGCVSNASVTLKLASNGALEYRWRHAIVPNIATATLSKSVP